MVTGISNSFNINNQSIYNIANVFEKSDVSTSSKLLSRMDTENVFYSSFYKSSGQSANSMMGLVSQKMFDAVDNSVARHPFKALLWRVQSLFGSTKAKAFLEENKTLTQANRLIKEGLLGSKGVKGKSLEEAVQAADSLLKKAGKSSKSVITEIGEAAAPEINSLLKKGTGKIFKNAAAEGASKGIGGLFKKVFKNIPIVGGLLQFAWEVPKIATAFKAENGGFLNGIKQLGKSVLYVGLDTAMEIGITAGLGLILGPAGVLGGKIASKAITKVIATMVPGLISCNIAEKAVDCLNIDVKGVAKTEGEAKKALRALGMSDDQIDQLCAQNGATASELYDYLQKQQTASTTGTETTASTTGSTNITGFSGTFAGNTGGGNFSNWLTSQTRSMNPSTGIYC